MIYVRGVVVFISIVKDMHLIFNLVEMSKLNPSTLKGQISFFAYGPPVGLRAAVCVDFQEICTSVCHTSASGELCDIARISSKL